MSEKKEKTILKLSFFSGMIFAAAEFIFAVYSHSQSVLTDAVYDATELVFIALLLFLTPLFHKPVSEKHPFGYFQIETVFIIIKGIMMLSVTMGVSAEIIHSVLSGGNHVDNGLISAFQSVLGILSLIIYAVMRKISRTLSSPAIKAELLSWKLDIMYSLGMSGAFFLSRYLEKSSLDFIVPYFDQIIAVSVMVFMLPESVQVLWRAIKEMFLFSPDSNMVEKIKEILNPVMIQYGYIPVFYDITKTGRHIWVAVYFHIEEEHLSVPYLAEAYEAVNTALKKEFPDSSCELIPSPGKYLTQQ